MKDDDLKPFKFFGLTLIQLMSLIAIVGIVLTLVLVHFFPQWT